MKKLLIFVLVSVFISGCSIQQLAIRSMAGLMNNGFDVLNEEQDLDLAEKSIASNLKLLEAMLKDDSDNENLLLLTCMGYTSYTIGFVEDVSQDRARLFYLRAKEYGMQILKKNNNFSKTVDGSPDDFTLSLKNFSKNDIPAIFWTALSWGSYVSLSLTDPEALADLPKIEAMMKFVAELDSNYYYGGSHFFLGALYGSRPKMFGGDPIESKKHFDKCLAINGGKFLMTYVYYARTYTVQVQDQEYFNQLLNKVDEASIDVLPEARLSNAIAKKKAENLRNLTNELF